MSELGDPDGVVRNVIIGKMIDDFLKPGLNLSSELYNRGLGDIFDYQDDDHVIAAMVNHDLADHDREMAWRAERKTTIKAIMETLREGE